MLGVYVSLFCDSDRVVNLTLLWLVLEVAFKRAE